MNFTTVPDDSSLAHPDEQWNMNPVWEGMALPNPIHHLGWGLHPWINRIPTANEIDNADQAQEINDCDVFVWQQSTFNHKAFVRWRNMQRSIAIAIFSPTWGIFARIPVWCVYLQVVNVVEEITVALQQIVNKLVLESPNQTLPLFECHIYEPIFENMTEEFVKCVTQVKEEVIRIVRPALTHFVHCKFKVKPFTGTLIDNDEDGPAVEAQWIPKAERMVLTICRELKPDGSYGKIENLDWVDDVVIEDVRDVPLPVWVEDLNRTESAFDVTATAQLVQRLYM
ncbi:hypothetical protein PISL3812_03902 [Talaromyces islandicus]|uniref:Uncharacterized protein n=1 Tax=Talaromyces islandicus TaxID=28573 RepID=A0A0U1LU00_TALIS|nr:hypothetical protein PISL3812_03902 [Talaromyces islandicus]